MAMYGYDTSTRVRPLFYHHHHYSDASHGPPNDDDNVSQHQGGGEGWVPKQREQQQQQEQQLGLPTGAVLAGTRVPSAGDGCRPGGAWNLTIHGRVLTTRQPSAPCIDSCQQPSTGTFFPKTFLSGFG